MIENEKSAHEQTFEIVHFDSEISDLKSCIIPANYDPQTFGSNGNQLRRIYYQELLNEYCRILKDHFAIDPKKQLEALQKKEVSQRSSQEQLLYRVLTDLISPISGKPSRKIVEQELEIFVDYEGRYWNFIRAHEELLTHFQEEKLSQNIQSLGRLLAYVRMIPRVGLFQQRLVRCYYHYLPEMEAKTFAKCFAIRNAVLKNVDPNTKLSPLWSCIRRFQGEFGILCDYFGYNPPNLRKVETWASEKGDERTIFNLRHPTPHNGSSVSHAYKEFLKCAAEKNEGVLYAVHQRFSSSNLMVSKLFEISGLQSEESRARSIVELEKKHPNLLVLVQSVESDLFQNRADTFEELKEALIASFKQKEGRCLNRLPHYLVKDVGDETFKIDEKYEKALREILDFVHEVFFGKERKTLSKEKVNSYGEGIEEKDFTGESQAFIMLFYHFQKEHLKWVDLTKNGYAFPVKFVNNGCKDAFDRAYAHNLVSDRVQQHQVHGKRVPAKDLEACASSGQAPPIHTKGIPVLPYRINTALDVSNLLANLNAKGLQALQEIRWNDWKIQKCDMV